MARTKVTPVGDPKPRGRKGKVPTQSTSPIHSLGFDEVSEEALLSSVEYQTLSRWFTERCNFPLQDAQRTSLRLIRDFKVKDLQTMYYLLMRDSKFLNQFLPVGYLVTVEQQLHSEFYRIFEQLSAAEIYQLFRNLGFSKGLCELFYVNEISGLVLQSLMNVETELTNLRVPSLVARSVAYKIMEWKACGVPRKYFLTNPDNVDVREELSQLIQLPSKLVDIVPQQEYSTNNSLFLPSVGDSQGNTTLQMALQTILEDLPANNLNCDHLDSAPGDDENDFDFEVFSSFDMNETESPDFPELSGGFSPIEHIPDVSLQLFPSNSLLNEDNQMEVVDSASTEGRRSPRCRKRSFSSCDPSFEFSGEKVKKESKRVSYVLLLSLKSLLKISFCLI
jgi:hypothetical protein